MPLDDPNTWAQATAALKAGFDTFRSAIALVKDIIRGTGATPAQQQVVDEALDKASAASKIAEAQIAKALGYELCKCEFPPVPMLTVGYLDNIHEKLVGPVYECPKCGFNSAGMWKYTRIAPKRPPAVR